MFLWQIHLVSLLSQDQKPITWVIGEYDSDPDIKTDDVLGLVWDVDKVRCLKVKVTSTEKVIYPKGTHSRYIDDHVLILKIFVEAEDRDELVQIADYLKQEFPREIDNENPIKTVQ